MTVCGLHESQIIILVKAHHLIFEEMLNKLHTKNKISLTKY